MKIAMLLSAYSHGFPKLLKQNRIFIFDLLK
jgi:hypothetical protein